MATLGVNIDHVATVRQARRTDEPDPVWAAVEAQLGGASCITFHLREDRRHIVDRDVALLNQTVSCRLNMEMAIAPEIVAIATITQPDQCCLVPEKREEVTTEGGLDVVKLSKPVGAAVEQLNTAGIRCSAFIEPDPKQIKTSAELGFKIVELWTGGYATAKTDDARKKAMANLQEGIRVATECGLEVHGGHGLTYRNVGPIAAMPGFTEFNIGHSIIGRSIFVGLRQAVAEMAALLEKHAPRGE